MTMDYRGHTTLYELPVDPPEPQECKPGEHSVDLESPEYIGDAVFVVCSSCSARGYILVTADKVEEWEL